MDNQGNTVTQLIQEDHRSKWIARSNHNVKCFTEDEIKGFTNNYEAILGRGGFGDVYKGVLEDKSIVAVKRFVCNVKEKENFAKELTIHREINHKNVVRLVGYCVDENALMVVTEYIPKGNLSDILHQDSTPIPLDTRLKIAIECAEALSYMHSQMYTRVIHGDIKPANILLDDGLGAKIADFGISRLVNSKNTLYTQNVIGSIGYMDPLFAQNGRLTSKSDVYSFGVVLVELITRKKARDENGGVGLVERFTQAHAKGIKRVREMFDAEIAVPNNIKIIEEIAKLSGKCLKMELQKRPEMLEVAECLCKLRRALHQGRERPALFSWGRKNKLGSVESTTSQESSGSTKNVGTFSIGSTMTSLFVPEDLLRGSIELLGKGTFGITYEAPLKSGYAVAVKRLITVDLPKDEFDMHCAMIGAIQNKHIAPLQWYFFCNKEKLLVYNFFPMGSLAHVLHGDKASPAPLIWRQRAAIALAAARGVAYIHSVRPSSCHGNIKSSNVMLTGTHDACISEHGLTAIGPFPGASGYTAPEITEDMRASQKADVYSFGVLLLELLTRRSPNTQLKDRMNLPKWVRSIAQHDWASLVIDMELLRHMRQEGVKECMVRLLQLAIHCCSEDANMRTTMSDVVQQIEKMQT